MNIKKTALISITGLAIYAGGFLHGNYLGNKSGMQSEQKRHKDDYVAFTIDYAKDGFSSVDGSIGSKRFHLGNINGLVNTPSDSFWHRIEWGYDSRGSYKDFTKLNNDVNKYFTGDGFNINTSYERVWGTQETGDQYNRGEENDNLTTVIWPKEAGQDKSVSENAEDRLKSILPDSSMFDSSRSPWLFPMDLK